MPAEQNVTTKVNMDTGEDRSITTADKNLSTGMDACDWYAIEKRLQSSKS